MKMVKLVSFLLSFTLLYSQQNESSLDVRIFRSINNNQTSLQKNIINITDRTLIPIAIATPLSIISYGLYEKNISTSNLGIEIASTQIISTIIRTVIKETVKRPRPFLTLENVHVSNKESATSYSFPSGHAMSAFALATSVSLNFPKKEIFIPMYLWASMVGYGRIYFGVHYPSDVLVGAVSGGLVGYSIHKFLQNEDYKIFKEKNNSSNLGNKIEIMLLPQIYSDYQGINLNIKF